MRSDNLTSEDIGATRPRYDRLAAVEQEWVRRRAPDVQQNMRIVEALYEEAIAVGAFPPADPLAGIEVDLRVARAFNV